MTKYRKKPVVIEAFKWTGGHDQTEDPEWIVKAINEGSVKVVMERDPYDPQSVKPTLSIETLEGVMTAQPGDYIIRGIQGEIYPCKPDIFEATYEKADTEGVLSKTMITLNVDKIVEAFSKKLEETIKDLSDNTPQRW